MTEESIKNDRDELNQKNERNDICYTMISSTAVLGIYCNFCDKMCDFGYSWPHQNIAFWTHYKNNVICPQCAKKYPWLVYRKLQSEKDIPLDRSYFKSNSRWDISLFSNNQKNKKTYSYKFCTPEQEQDEFSGRVPFVQKSCGCSSCEPRLNKYDDE